MKKMGLVAAAIGLLWTSAAFAHHPFSDEFDKNKPVTLTGTVTKIEWQNPHVFTNIDVKDAQGNVVNWRLEMGSPDALTTQGWTRTSVKIGDQVTVKRWRAKDGTNLANANTFTLASGQNIAAASSFHEAPTMARKETRGTQPVGTAGTEALPATASPLPLYALLAALSLAGALGIRAIRH